MSETGKKIKLGIAPIGWTNDDLPELGGHIPLEQCLDEMAQTHFEGCELGNKFPRDPELLHPLLKARHLDLASGWFSSFFTENDPKTTVDAFVQHRDFLYAMGAKVIVVCECGHAVQGKAVPVFSTKPIFNETQWDLLVTGLEILGRLAQEKEMRLVYHYHMGTGVQTRNDIDQLMTRTSPEWVALLVDTGHLVYAGDDPLSLIQAYPERVKHVHLKDIRKTVLDQVHSQHMSFLDSVKAGVFTVPGDGMIDFPPLFEALQQQNFQGWFIVEAEQDPEKANPLEYARKARNFLYETLNL